MLVLLFKKFVDFKPVPWKETDRAEANEGLIFTQFMGEHPSRPERGTVTLHVKLIDGSFDQIEELRFILEGMMSARLVSHKKRLLGGYDIEVDFNTVFHHGLNYCLSMAIPSGAGIIAFTKEEKESMDTMETQRQLLDVLSKMTIPSRSAAMDALARPSLRLLVNPEAHSQSHFVGPAQIPLNGKVPLDRNGKPMFHLGTIHTAEIAGEIANTNLPTYISFYIRIDSTEDGWPTQEGDFKVLAYDDATTVESTFEHDRTPVPMQFKPFLDLPRYDHCALQLLRLNDDEQNRFEALESSYKGILDPDHEFNSYHKWGGYPDNVQHCVAYWAELIKNKREHSDAIVKDGAQWALLLQVNPYAHWFGFHDIFGDGSIYFMIREADLRVADFSTVQVVVQNT